MASMTSNNVGSQCRLMWLSSCMWLIYVTAQTILCCGIVSYLLELQAFQRYAVHADEI